MSTPQSDKTLKNKLSRPAVWAIGSGRRHARVGDDGGEDLAVDVRVDGIEDQAS
ncbi:hypothetical protein OG949_41435 (plasmid) [Streptomyces scopuliridis]|uniref:hypothetical protein n=1 Tax=Streptomyces scopuliridis TaxID=452529 RepID=UPI002DD8054E|nr:hypothetical protein [Streptomyces scopuliridis]WSB39206.1 hypothetical protein OG949_41435 [Streptomyces scopuliridis]